MGKFANDIFVPKNPQKYIGNHKPRYRSSWEMTFMMMCDNHKSILSWASEPMQIPYRNPVTGKQTVYVPDFFVLYEDKYGNKKAEIVEIKPKKQSLIESRTASARDRAIVAINHAKWEAASNYCKRAGLIFRVINEDNIFYNSRR